jgi:hypothetical protein
LEHPRRLQGSLFRDDSDAAREAAGRQRHVRAWITEEVGKVETALAEEALRVDSEPPPGSTVQHVVVMQISMQHDGIGWVVEQRVGQEGRSGEGASVPNGGFAQRLEPDFERHQGRRRLAPARSVKPRGDLAKDEGRFVVSAFSSHSCEASIASGAFEENGRAIVGEDAG